MTRHTPLLLALLLPACAPRAQAQTVPGTEIWLVEMTARDGRPAFGAPVNVTRRAGYDNQPSFTPDGGAVLYTSRRDDEQSDIYRYELASGATTRVTRTPESEYSPTVVPGGGAISVVRVEADSTQRLWRFPLDGGAPELVLEEVRPVGYHAWVDGQRLALFVLGSPPTLQLADTRTGRAEVVASDIGRSLHRVPGREGAVSFLHKVSPGEWWIRELRVSDRRVAPRVRALPGVEDYAWTPDGTVLMGRGSRLYRWRPGMGPGWEIVADFAGAGIGGITRLAVSPRGDRLALVAAER